MYLVSAFMENYGGGEIEAVKKAVQTCNDVFLCTYHGVDCESRFFDVNEDGKKSINMHGEEFVDFWDAYKEYHDDCQDMNDLPVVVAAREVMEIRERAS